MDITKEMENRFIDRTIRHIRRVQDNMILLFKNIEQLPFEIEFEWDLINKSLWHNHTQ